MPIITFDIIFLPLMVKDLKIQNKNTYLKNMYKGPKYLFSHNSYRSRLISFLVTDLVLLLSILLTMRSNINGLNGQLENFLHYSLPGMMSSGLLILTSVMFIFWIHRLLTADRYPLLNESASSRVMDALQVEFIHNSEIIMVMLDSIRIDDKLFFSINFVSNKASEVLNVQMSSMNSGTFLSDLDSTLSQKSIPICTSSCEANEYREEEIDVPGAEPDTLEWYRCQVWPHFNSLLMVLTRTTDTHWLNELIKQQIDSITESHIELEEHATNLAGANQRLEDLAATDGLTGLKNHRAFQQEMRRLFERHIRSSSPLSLILLDVDHFKKYNDSMGHPAGDELLKKLGDILLTSARHHDFAARYGGEEFVILLPNTDVDGSIKFAERLRQLVADESWENRPVTISLGIATLNETLYSPELILEAADRALYISKRAGRNQATHIMNIENRSVL